MVVAFSGYLIYTHFNFFVAAGLIKNSLLILVLKLKIVLNGQNYLFF